MKTVPSLVTLIGNSVDISCGADCADLFDYGTAITLTATDDGSLIFTG
ncbi:MAG: hypothetical protein AAF902_11930 [Chloroflexota bacterium]